MTSLVFQPRQSIPLSSRTGLNLLLSGLRLHKWRALANYLTKGGDPNAIVPHTGTSLLFVAVWNKSYRAVVLLLKHGANPRWREPGTLNTPLHIAANLANLRMSRTLLRNGGVLDDENAEGSRPLDCIPSDAILSSDSSKARLRRIAFSGSVRRVYTAAMMLLHGESRFRAFDTEGVLPLFLSFACMEYVDLERIPGPRKAVVSGRLDFSEIVVASRGKRTQ